MQNSGLTTLAIMTDPVSVHLLDLLEDGPRSRAELAEQVRERLGTDESFVPGRLARLAGVGLVCCLDADADAGAGADAELWQGTGSSTWRARIDEMIELVVALKTVDDQQVADLTEAMAATWDARSASRQRRRRADLFRSSPAGRRHARRVAAGTLGRPDDADGSHGVD